MDRKFLFNWQKPGKSEQKEEVPKERRDFLNKVKLYEDYLFNKFSEPYGPTDERSLDMLAEIKALYQKNRELIGSIEDLEELNQSAGSPIERLAVYIMRDGILR